MATQGKGGVRRLYESLVLCGQKSAAVKGSTTTKEKEKAKAKEKKRRDDDDCDEQEDLGTSSAVHGGYGYRKVGIVRLFKAGITLAFSDDLSMKEKEILGLIGPAPYPSIITMKAAAVAEVELPIPKWLAAYGRAIRKWPALERAARSWDELEEAALELAALERALGLRPPLPKQPNRVKVVFKSDLSPEMEEELKSAWRPHCDRHPSIIYFKANNLSYGMEYATTNLRDYMYSEEMQNFFTIDQVKKMTKQLLKGLLLLHQKGFMHLDLNPYSIPVTRGGDLQIWNFHTAARFGGDDPSPAWPFTDPYEHWDWHRAPELLQPRWRRYSSEVDMWSVGCIMAELVLHRRLFNRVSRRKDDFLSSERRKQEQLDEIDRVLNETTSSTMSILRDALRKMALICSRDC